MFQSSHPLARALMAGLVAGALLAAPASSAFAGASDSLFINLTSDEGHRVNMALAFGGAQLKRGHHLTVFLNDKAVLVASKANAETFAAQQKTLTELMASGATILVCPFCMEHYGVKETDLMPGLKKGNPELTGGALFAGDTKTMSW